MKIVRAARPTGFFRVVAGTRRSQAATMVLRPGQSTGGSDNVHEEADQWLYVISGTGRAVIGGRAVALDPGTLLLIEAGETHGIRNIGDEPLVTINLYSPPVY